MSASEKSLLRARCRALRDTMTSEAVASASARACEHLAAWPRFQQARAVMAYMAFRNEISLTPLMSQFSNKQWVIPRIVTKPRARAQLILHPYDPARLARHPFGMLEPDANLPEIEPSALDLALVPGVAFDWRGDRLGFGGGFYDRLLPRVTAVKVGVVYAALIVDRVPHDSHDQRVDFLACELSIIRSITDHGSLIDRITEQP